MSLPVRSWHKRALLRLGTRLSARHLVLADATVSFLALGRWAAERGMPVAPVVGPREDLFAIGVERLAGRRGLYVELGVYQGASLRWWAEHLRDPEARFVGFDSFEGLPERWNEQNPRGRFSTGGALPRIDDDRVTLVKGWLEETLPGWEAPEHEALFVAVDVDLYSSTATALRELAPLLVPGTLVYFDELADRTHELRAFDEFLDATGMAFRVVGVSEKLSQWLFERVA